MINSSEKPQKEFESEDRHAKFNETEWVKTFLETAFEINLDQQNLSAQEKLLEISGAALRTPGALSDDLIAALLLVLPAGDGESKINIVVARNLSAEEKKIVLPVNGSFIEHVINEGQPRLLKDGQKDVLIEGIGSLSACRSFYCVPASQQANPRALLFFAHQQVEFFTPDRRQTLSYIGYQAKSIVEHFYAPQKMKFDQQRLLGISQRWRKKLARQLHDGPTQAVAALAMRMNIIRRLLQQPSAELSEELDKIEELARRTTKEMRHSLFALHPGALETQGLEAALSDLAEKMLATFNQKVSLTIEPDSIADISMDAQALIFDIAMEAVDNARLHAEANNIWLRVIKADEYTVLLEIEDDGIGFNPAAQQSVDRNRTHFGLLNMRALVELFQGKLEIESRSG
ncbi:MAG: sensor histidine kinase, partial [Anaerolineales bacterium]